MNFLESLKELGNYSGDFLQARAALDKSEEGETTKQEILDWAKKGLLNVIDQIKNVLDPFDNFSTGLILINNIEQHLKAIKLGSNANEIAINANSIRYDCKKLSSVMYERFPNNRHDNLKFEPEIFKQVYPLWLKLNEIMKQHVSGGTRELVNSSGTNERKLSLMLLLHNIIQKENGNLYGRSSWQYADEIYSYRQNRSINQQIYDLHELNGGARKRMVILLLSYLTHEWGGRISAAEHNTDIQRIHILNNNPLAREVMSPRIKKIIDEILSIR